MAAMVARFEGAELSAEQRELRRFYGDILRLANQAPFAEGLRYNIQHANAGRPDHDSGQHVYSFLRHDTDGRRALVVVNFSATQALQPTVRLPADALAKMGLDADAVVRLRVALGRSRLPAAARAGALVERGVTVALEPFGVAVVFLDAAT